MMAREDTANIGFTDKRESDAQVILRLVSEDARKPSYAGKEKREKDVLTRARFL